MKNINFEWRINVTLIFRKNDRLQRQLQEEQIRLGLFLVLPALILFSSIFWLFLDWMSIIRYTFGKRPKKYLNRKYSETTFTEKNLLP